MQYTTTYFEQLCEAVRSNNLPSNGPELSEEIITIKRQKVKLELSLALKYPKLVESLKSLSTRRVYFTFADVPARAISGPLSMLALNVGGKQVDLILAGHNGYYVIVAAFIDEPMFVYDFKRSFPSTSAAA